MLLERMLIVRISCVELDNCSVEGPSDGCSSVGCGEREGMNWDEDIEY